MISTARYKKNFFYLTLSISAVSMLDIPYRACISLANKCISYMSKSCQIIY
uniref:Uncharacterized protein n=1 Tax=Arundo donax TaxID=35708 RepID=A0A0A9GUN1_ARUDO